jgi:AmiR/NasT family two-component response regulator
MQSAATTAKSGSRFGQCDPTRMLVVSPSAPMRGVLQDLASEDETTQVVGIVAGVEQLRQWMRDRRDWNVAVVDSRPSDETDQVIARLRPRSVLGRIIVLVDALTPTSVEKYLGLGADAVVEKANTTALRDRLSWG